MLPKTQKHHTRAKSCKPAEEILQAREHKNKMVALGKNFPIFWVGSGSVLKVARLCFGLKIEKKHELEASAELWFCANA